MEKQLRWRSGETDQNSCQKAQKDCCTSPNFKWILLCLGLLNAVLLLVAVILGIKCADAKKDPSRSQLAAELTVVHRNDSDPLKAEQEAQKALQTTIMNTNILREQIEQKKILNKDYLIQLKDLQEEKANLQVNVSNLGKSCGNCQPGWVLLNSSCYFFSHFESGLVEKSWHDSREDCIGRGSDLVVIDNSVEQAFVSTVIKSTRPTTNRYRDGFWIGLTDQEVENTWKWINNVTEVEQRYWMGGEPDNEWQHGRCVAATYSSFIPWKTRFDYSCQHKSHWVCKTKKKTHEAVAK